MIKLTKIVEEFKPMMYSDNGNLVTSKRYLASNTGKIHDTVQDKLMDQTTNYQNYKTVGISTNDNKWVIFFVHRLIAMTFIPNPENKPEVNHIRLGEADRSFNYAINLEWATHRENMHHRYLNDGSGKFLYTEEMDEFLLIHMKDNITWNKPELIKLFKRHFEIDYDDSSVLEKIQTLMKRNQGNVNISTRQDMLTHDDIHKICKLLTVEGWDPEVVAVEIFGESYNELSNYEKTVKKKKIFEIYKGDTFKEISKDYEFKERKQLYENPISTYTQEMTDYLFNYMKDTKTWTISNLIVLFQEKFNPSGIPDKSVYEKIRFIMRTNQGVVNRSTRDNQLSHDQLLRICEMLCVEGWDAEEIVIEIFGKEEYEKLNVMNRFAKRKLIKQIHQGKMYARRLKEYNFEFKNAS